MADKLKLSPLLDDKPVKVTLEIPAQVWRLLQAFAEALGANPADPARLITPMVERFMATDRAFVRGRPKRKSDQTR